MYTYGEKTIEYWKRRARLEQLRTTVLLEELRRVARPGDAVSQVMARYEWIPVGPEGREDPRSVLEREVRAFSRARDSRVTSRQVAPITRQ